MKRILITILLLFAVQANAATYYCDPVGGNTSTGDGSSGNPWGTLESVFAANLFGKTAESPTDGGTIQGGDTVKLRTGYHGEINDFGKHYTSFVTIEPDTGHFPELKALRLHGAEYWHLKSLTVSREFDGHTLGGLIEFEDHSTWGICNNIWIEDCNVFAVSDITGWDANDWDANTLNVTGIQVTGPNSIVQDNFIRNVMSGINCTGENNLIENNTIDGYWVDGIFSLDVNQICRNNLIQNVYDVAPGTHSDAIQIWGTIPHTGLRIYGNIIIETTDSERSLIGEIGQGIQATGGGVDPVFLHISNDGITIFNNVVIGGHPSGGIEIIAAQNCLIVNNTMVRQFGGTSEPFIRISKARDYEPDPSNTIVRNNIAHAFPDADAPNDVVIDFNLDADDHTLTDLFVDYQNNDLSLKAGSAAIDAGNSVLTPTIDILEVLRDGSPDIGAYENTDAHQPSGPPTPNPATWASVPAADGNNAISMTATGGSGDEPINYFFWEVSENPGGTNSGWQAGTSYTDSGLDGGTVYSYKVQLRDVNELTGLWSLWDSNSATPTDLIVPAPSPATWSVVPIAVSASSITMTATTATDDGPTIQYQFAETSGNSGGTSSGWQESATYVDTGLQSGTTYTYTVQSRDSVPNTGTASSGASATTQTVYRGRYGNGYRAIYRSRYNSN